MTASTPQASTSVEKAAAEEEHWIKPQATAPAIDTSQWPLLLKGYDKRELELTCVVFYGLMASF